MRKYLISILFISFLISDSFNMQLLSHMEFDAEASDITGFAQDGREFAVIGLMGDDCAAFIDITDPVNPFEVARIPGLPSTWRDLKYWDSHVYIGTEADEGVKVIDVTDLDNPELVYTINDFLSSHNIHVYDGYLYVVGAATLDENNLREVDDILIYDLSNPAMPEYVGGWIGEYIHDLEVYNDKAYAMGIYTSTAYIIDVSDKSNPVTLTSWQYPGMAHDCAVTPDENYLVTADEMEGGYIRIWDIQDYNNPIELDYFITDPAHSVHNVYIKENLLYVSWYADGTRIFDISDPENIAEVAYYDTSEVEGLYVGNWGVYVYLPSGRIISSDIETGLYVTELGGVSIQHTNIPDSEPNIPYMFFSADVSSFIGSIESVTLHYSTNGYDWSETQMTSSDGSTYDAVMSFDEYNTLVYYYISAIDDDANSAQLPIEGEDNPFFFIYGELDNVVYDDFENDSGWETGLDDTAVGGVWERAVPNGTIYQGQQVQPDEDNSEAGDYCFVTGNGGNPANVGADDIDGGYTSIISPVYDLSGYDDVLLTYFRWFTNNLGDNPSTDKFSVQVTNDGGDNWLFLENTSLSNNSWERKRFILSDYIELSSQIRFKITAEDVFNNGDFGSGGSLVEAAFDDFSLLNIPFYSPSLAGDINGDMSVNVVDVVLLVNFVLEADFPDNEEFSLSDINNDNILNVLDVVLLVDIIIDE